RQPDAAEWRRHCNNRVARRKCIRVAITALSITDIDIEEMHLVVAPDLGAAVIDQHTSGTRATAIERLIFISHCTSAADDPHHVPRRLLRDNVPHTTL